MSVGKMGVVVGWFVSCVVLLDICAAAVVVRLFHVLYFGDLFVYLG